VPEPAYSFDAFRDALGDDFYADDPFFAQLLRHHGITDPKTLARIERYGKFVASAGLAGAEASDRPDQLPVLKPFDAFGELDPVGVQVHPATRRVLAASLRAGTATDPNVFVRYALAYLSGQPGEGGVNCPLACTDGMVRALQELEGGDACAAALSHILTQAPGGPVHAAQFVTEVQGGSDAATNNLEATPQPDGSWRLSGKKWFCSNPWAQYWAVTARPVDAPAGPRGVGLFLVPREHPAGVNNGFRLDRLKDKLGTRSLPTGEMTFDGAVGWSLGPLQSGLSNVVAIVLTTSRFWNALLSASHLRAAERIATAYAAFREAFGQRIVEFPLVEHTLAQLTKDRRNQTAAAFEVLAAWEAARVEGASADDMARLRVLMMLAKTCSTRRCTQRIHDAMMVLGGNGIEERFSALPRLWRDAAIMETWEGPHGLLLGRSLLDLRKFGAADAPERWTGLLLGEGAPGDVVAELGGRLGEVMADPDPVHQAVAFQDWATDLYDAFGEVAAAAVSSGQ